MDVPEPWNNIGVISLDYEATPQNSVLSGPEDDGERFRLWRSSKSRAPTLGGFEVGESMKSMCCKSCCKLSERNLTCRCNARNMCGRDFC